MTRERERKGERVSARGRRQSEMRRSRGGYEAEENTVFTCVMQPYKLTVPAHSNALQYTMFIILAMQKGQATRFKLECNIHTYIHTYVRMYVSECYIISLKWVPHVLYALWYGIREICIDSC